MRWSARLTNWVTIFKVTVRAFVIRLSMTVSTVSSELMIFVCNQI